MVNLAKTDLIGCVQQHKTWTSWCTFLIKITWPSSAAPPIDPTPESHLLTHNLLPTLNPTQMPVSDVATLADARQLLSCTSLHFNRHLSFFFFFLAFPWIYFAKPTLLLMDVLHASLVVLILRLAVKIIREKRNSFFPPTRSLCSILSPLLFVAAAAAMLGSVLPRLPSLLRYWVSLWVSHCDSECWLQRCQHNCSLFGFFCTSSFRTIFSVAVAIGQKTQCVLVTFFCEAELTKEFQLNPQTLWIDKQQVILLFFFSFSRLRSWHFVLMTLHNGHQSVSFFQKKGIFQCKTS